MGFKNINKAFIAAMQAAINNNNAKSANIAANAMQQYWAAIYKNNSPYCKSSIYDLFDAELDTPEFYALYESPAWPKVKAFMLANCK